MGNEQEKVNKLIAFGSEIVGSALGGALGTLAVGPVGGAAGGMTGVVVAKGLCELGAEIYDRVLGKREKIRIGATISMVAQKVEENIKAGQKIREDDFFIADKTHRSSFDEVAEGVMLASQKEHEEKKLKFGANLLANIAFDKSITKSHANLLLKVFDRLSYRQLIILAVLANKNKYMLRSSDYRGGGAQGTELIALLQEIMELYNLGMLNGSGEAWIGLSDVNPGKSVVQGVGGSIYNLCQLSQIADSEALPVATMLK